MFIFFPEPGFRFILWQETGERSTAIGGRASGLHNCAPTQEINRHPHDVFPVPTTPVWTRMTHQQALSHSHQPPATATPTAAAARTAARTAATTSNSDPAQLPLVSPASAAGRLRPRASQRQASFSRGFWILDGFFSQFGEFELSVYRSYGFHFWLVGPTEVKTEPGLQPGRWSRVHLNIGSAGQCSRNSECSQGIGFLYPTPTLLESSIVEWASTCGSSS